METELPSPHGCPARTGGLRERGDQVGRGGVPSTDSGPGKGGHPLLWGQEGQPPPVPAEPGDVAPRWEAGQVGLVGGAAGRPPHSEL